MALYLIGDVQGCDAALDRLLAKIGFSASRDRLVLLGDLVNRGPNSLGVLRRVRGLDGAAEALLGNHDIHLLARAAGVRGPGRHDTLDDVLQAPDAHALLDWLRCRPLALHEADILMVHAGVLPQWTLRQTLERARELQDVLCAPDWRQRIGGLFGNQPGRWHDGLEGDARLRVIVNALTRLRFCTADGAMDFGANGGLETAPDGAMAWFDVPGRQTQGQVIAFGHWSALAPQQRNDIFALDSGCVWGRALTALCVAGDDPAAWERVTVSCATRR